MAVIIPFMPFVTPNLSELSSLGIREPEKLGEFPFPPIIKKPLLPLNSISAAWVELPISKSPLF